MLKEKKSEIIKKLNLIMGLLFISVINREDKKLPEKDLMLKLKKFGLENTEIGILFDKSGEQVAKQIYETKRKKKVGKK